MKFNMAEAPGQAFTLLESVQEVFAGMELGPLKVAMSGGEQAEVLECLISHPGEDAPAQGYLKHPRGMQTDFRYSSLPGARTIRISAGLSAMSR